MWLVLIKIELLHPHEQIGLTARERRTHNVSPDNERRAMKCNFEPLDLHMLLSGCPPMLYSMRMRPTQREVPSRLHLFGRSQRSRTRLRFDRCKTARCARAGTRGLWVTRREKSISQICAASFDKCGNLPDESGRRRWTRARMIDRPRLSIVPRGGRTHEPFDDVQMVQPIYFPRCEGPNTGKSLGYSHDVERLCW